MNGVRDVMFLQDGQIMVVTSTWGQKLVFFNRSTTAPVNCMYIHSLPTSYPAPHGLRYVNDFFFYATSWDGNSVFSHTTIDGVTWTETLFANLNVIVSSGEVAHVMIDDCGRRWVSRASGTMIIYGSGGAHIGNFKLPSVGIFHALFMDNYVLYVANSWGWQLFVSTPTSHVELFPYGGFIESRVTG